MHLYLLLGIVDLQRKIQKSLQSFESFPSKQTPRGANTAKISKIVEKLCPHMDSMKRKFWIDLPCNELSLDLQNTRDKKRKRCWFRLTFIGFLTHRKLCSIFWIKVPNKRPFPFITIWKNFEPPTHTRTPRLFVFEFWSNLDWSFMPN